MHNHILKDYAFLMLNKNSDKYINYFLNLHYSCIICLFENFIPNQCVEILSAINNCFYSKHNFIWRPQTANAGIWTKKQTAA